MNFRLEDKTGKQFRCDARRVRYDRGAQVFFENKDLGRDFAEFAGVMTVLLNSRRALARQSGGSSVSCRTAPGLFDGLTN